MRKNTNNNTGRMMNITAYLEYVGLGRNSGMKFAEDANAIIRVGKRLLFDRKKIDAAIDAMTSEEG